MDALGGYGSSDLSDNDTGDEKPKSALSGLLANLSDASDDDDDDVVHAAAAADAAEATTTDDNGNEANEPPKKKLRRGGDEVGNDDSISCPQQHVLLPPPVVSASINSTIETDNINTDVAPFQSLIHSTKDYTSDLRQTLTQQLQSQTSEMSQKQKRLAEKLKLLHETFQNKSDTEPNNTTTSISSSSSFASHLKSKQEFGNPHLLKDIIDHFQITPLDSRQFKQFEFFDRLQISEEKARIAAANYDAGI